MVDDDTLSEWCLIESDPWVFTDLLIKLGVTGIQMIEICSLDELPKLSDVYALLFLFKCKKEFSSPNYAYSGAFIQKAEETGIYFAKQAIVNACATQALVNMLLNLNDAVQNFNLGSTLRNFKELSSAMTSQEKGKALDFCSQIREAHNSFNRASLYSIEGESETSKESFHYVGFVPINGHLIELDGLKEYPIDHGEVGSNWLEFAAGILQSRMPEAETGDFNLLAVSKDRRESIEAELAELQAQSTQPGQSDDSIQRQLERIEELQNLLESEAKQRAQYEIDKIRHHHNWTPFLMETMKLLARHGVLTKAILGQLKG